MGEHNGSAQVPPVRRVVCLISAKGKSQEQLKAEAREALRKWQEAQKPQQ